MKQVLTIWILSLTIVSYSQEKRDIDYFINVHNDNDSTYNYYKSLLNNFDSTKKYINLDYENASEKIGDYFNFRHDYKKAIAYYDSTDTKYRNNLQLCGNDYYIDFIPRRYKVSKCYLNINDIDKAIQTLTPYIFDNFGSSYFDSSMISYYAALINLKYSKDEIKSELKNSIDSIKYYWKFNHSGKNIEVICRFKIFDTEIDLANYSTSTETKYQIPFNESKEMFIKQIKELKIYMRLLN